MFRLQWSILNLWECWTVSSHISTLQVRRRGVLQMWHWKRSSWILFNIQHMHRQQVDKLKNKYFQFSFFRHVSSTNEIIPDCECKRVEMLTCESAEYAVQYPSPRSSAQTSSIALLITDILRASFFRVIISFSLTNSINSTNFNISSSSGDYSLDYRGGCLQEIEKHYWHRRCF